MTDMDKWPYQAKQMILDASTEEELADILGDLHSVSRRLAALKGEHDKEMPDVVYGERWKFERPLPANKYSFNTDGILSLVMQKTAWNLGEALSRLLEAGAITLTWKISKLKPFLKAYRITGLKTVTEPVYDGDDYHIGSVDARVYPKYTAITDE